MPFIPDANQPGTGTGAGIGASVGTGVLAGGMLDSKALDAAKVETGKLIDAAKSGGFRISEEGMKPLRQALVDSMSIVDEMEMHVNDLGLAPKLGSHDYGQRVAAHDQKAGEGAIDMVHQLREVLQGAAEAVERAAGVYGEADSSAAGDAGAGSA